MSKRVFEIWLVICIFSFVCVGQDIYVPDPQNVQELLWTCGCAPTAGAMVLDYLDTQYGYGRLVDYYIERQVVSDTTLYTYQYGGNPEDSAIGSIVQLAENMETTFDGSTYLSKTAPGIYKYTNQDKGYNFLYPQMSTLNTSCTCINCAPAGDGVNWQDYWNLIKQTINEGYPFIWSFPTGFTIVDKDYGGATFEIGHAVCVFGYTSNDYYLIVYHTFGLSGVISPGKHWWFAFDQSGNNHQSWILVVKPDVQGFNPYHETVRLESPGLTPGEEYFAGETLNISWFHQDSSGVAITNVCIMISYDGGQTWSYIGVGIPSYPGSNMFQYQLPDFSEDQTRVRIWIQGASSNEYLAGDGSRFSFTIKAVQSSHQVSVPDTPTGPDELEVNQSGSYTTGGATCNLGHSISYRFDWGDGNISSWGSASASYAWSSAGTYYVKAQARCSEGVESSWSTSLTVSVSSPTTHTISNPDTPQGLSQLQTNQSGIYTTGGAECSLGHSISYRFDWGDGSVSSWGSSSQSHAWAIEGTYYVKAQARCSEGIESGWTSALPVSVVAGTGEDNQSVGSDWGGGGDFGGCGGVVAFSSGGFVMKFWFLIILISGWVIYWASRR